RLRHPHCRVDAPDDAGARPEDGDHVLAVGEEGPPPAVAPRGGERSSDQLARREVPEPEIAVGARGDELGPRRVECDAEDGAVLTSERPADLQTRHRAPEGDVAVQVADHDLAAVGGESDRLDEVVVVDRAFDRPATDVPDDDVAAEPRRGGEPSIRAEVEILQRSMPARVPDQAARADGVDAELAVDACGTDQRVIRREADA